MTGGHWLAERVVAVDGETYDIHEGEWGGGDRFGDAWRIRVYMGSHVAVDCKDGGRPSPHATTVIPWASVARVTSLSSADPIHQDPKETP